MGSSFFVTSFYLDYFIYLYVMYKYIISFSNSLSVPFNRVKMGVASLQIFQMKNFEIQKKNLQYFFPFFFKNNLWKSTKF